MKGVLLCGQSLYYFIYLHVIIREIAVETEKNAVVGTIVVLDAVGQ